MRGGSSIFRKLTAASCVALIALGAGAVAAADTAKPASATAGAQQWQAGTHYTPLEKPQPTRVARGKIEIIEVFWYGCGHCYALDPALESWKASKPAFIEFVRIPVIWTSPAHRQHARLYYTLEALGRLDLHPTVFDAIHQRGIILAARSEEAARAQQMNFLKEHGITEKAFNEAYDSTAVTAQLQRAEQATASYQVATVPLLIVNGKFTTSVSQAGGANELVALITDLASSERKRR